MNSAPSALTVARSRYWTTAFFRLAGLLIGIWFAVDAIVVCSKWIGQAVMSPAGMSEFSVAGAYALGQLTPSVVVAAVGFTLFWLAPRVSRALLPAVGAFCHRCGYSRRGLVSTAPCPECGTPAEGAGARA